MSEVSFLLVQAGTRMVGVPVDQLVAVADLGSVLVVPTPEPAMRGVAVVRGTTMPVIHLAALLDGTACPPGRGNAGVVVSIDGQELCLEVDGADVVVREPTIPLSHGSAMPWARALVRRPEGLVPLLDLSALAARLAATGTDS